MVIYMIEHKPPRAYPVPNREGLFSTYAWHPGMKQNYILRMSKSSLGDSTFCAQQYFIGRIIGMKEPQNDDMLRGTNVHDIVEQFYDNVDIEYAKGLDADKVDMYFQNCMPDATGLKKPQEVFTLDEDLHLDRYRVAEVQRFLSSDPDNFLPTGNELLVDDVVEVEVDGIKQLVHFTGFIDRIFTNPDGTLHIHELKTGLWKDKPFKYNSMRKEMAFYVWLLRKTDNSARITHWGWDHTKGLQGETEESEVFRHVEPVRVKEIGEMLADMHNLIRMHRRYKGDGEGSMFALIPEYRQYNICDPWCGLKEFCPRYTQHLEEQK